MAANTPWCPRCGAWRGYIAALCKGCVTINTAVEQEFPERTDLTAEGFIEYNKAKGLRLRELVQKRFLKISEMRTDREAFTQALEEMVDQNTDVLKQVCMDWMRMRPESRRVRFSNMFAMEIITVARQALEMVGALSLELLPFTENKARHEEIMKQVTYGMQAVEMFVNPEANEPELPKEEKDEDETDLPPGTKRK
jgi:hypothetical protein